MFNHAIYDFSRLRMNYFSLGLAEEKVNFFGDHFSPIIFLFAPLRYVFGVYTLDVVQIGFILFGGLGVYKLALFKLQDKNLSLILTIHFFGAWGILSALSFGYHSNTVGSMLIPWLVYSFFKDNRKKIIIFTVLILACKENMSLLLIFINCSFIVHKFFNKNKRDLDIKFEALVMLFCVIYLIVIISSVMPYLSEGKGTNQIARYHLLGTNIKEVFMFILKNPLESTNIFLSNTTTDSSFDGIKFETFVFFAASGGIFVFFRPKWILCLIPIFAQKYFTDNPVMWGVNCQYSIEFVPIISICLIEFLTLTNKVSTKFLTISLITISTFYINFGTIYQRKSPYYDPLNLDSFNAEHYKSSLGADTEYIRNKIKELPADANLTVSGLLAPKLAFRDNIYLFPVINDAEYIVLLCDNNNTYPFSFQQFKSMLLNDLTNHTGLELISCEKGLFIAKIKPNGITRNEILDFSKKYPF
jgi:uncharacterized membrane protein